jgi:hypothetical protein
MLQFGSGVRPKRIPRRGFASKDAWPIFLIELESVVNLLRLCRERYGMWMLLESLMHERV